MSTEIEITVRCTVEETWRGIVPHVEFFDKKMREALEHAPPEKIQLTLFSPRIVGSRMVERRLV